ncbi:hypothetical protein B0H16DRAFT_940785 [Mycena metata]|uniref:MYND-type domain-containing protein n=1 Tax=Mycena metata TaxID=1033252 RepID=A0AAD7IMH1_9AGAR|nr:hypothetical protein B0H16DRAFT_940785 [Mycena metata]
MAALSRPLLPDELVEKVLTSDMMFEFPTSEVFSQNSHEERLSMRNFQGPLSPDSFFVQELTIGWTKEMNRTPLHLAAYDGDVLAVYERIGLGTTVDKPDASGITPICLAVSQLALILSPHVISTTAGGSLLSASALRREVSRLECVIRILVEQHVVLDRSVDGQPLINLLCRSAAWDTIALFLEHGATPPATITRLFKTAADRARFTSLVKSHTAKPRPPRKCPCWSGKIISECHGKEDRPYPLGYICVCGSKRTYKKCCFGRRNVVEYWDPTLKRIMHDYEKSRKAVQDLGLDTEDPFFTQDLSPEIIKQVFKGLLHEKSLDAAFAYALVRVDFVPRPESRKGLSRHLSEIRQRRWNALVDEYIKTQGDNRSQYDIERAAKIGTWNGALLRACEGPGCEKIEGNGSVTLKLCGKCQISVYCTHVCQKAAWKTHKAECGKDGQREQSLPSQDVVAKYLKHLTEDVAEVLRRLRDLSSSPASSS